MAGYIRQSTFVDGDTITAALFNDEYNQLVNAFSNTSGHKHDGTTAEGPVIGLIGDAGETSPNNKVLIDTTNNYIEFYVEVSSAPVQQLYIADGAIIPVTDSDIDLGTTSLRFKDTYTDTVTTTGNVSIGGDLTVTGSATISGNLTFGDADTDSINLAAEIDSHIVPNTDDTYDLGTSTKQWRNLYIDGTAEIDTLAINGTTVTSTAAEINLLDGVTSTTAELNILDGVTSTATELNIVDGDTAATSTTLADADRVVVNDAGTMKQVALTDFETYFEGALDTLSNVTTVGALNAGSITSGFGAIDNGSSAITTTGTLTYGNLSDGTITITAFVDEDDMSSNSATLVPTQQSVKAYVDSQVTAQDLDFQGDTGGALSIDLDSESLTIAGGTGLDTVGSGNTVTINIDSTVATLTGTQTLTNKTLTSPDVNTPDIDGGTIDGTVIGGATTAAGSFTTLQADTSLNIDGTATADGLTIEGLSNATATTAFSTTANTPNASLIIGNSAATTGDGNYKGALGFAKAGTSSQIRSAIVGKQTASSNNVQGLAFLVHPNSVAGSLTEALLIKANNDIIFYDDTGTSQALYWDASAESLGIGTTSVSAKLHVESANNYNGTNFESNPHLVIDNGTTTNHTAVLMFESSGTDASNKRSGITGGNYYSNKHGLGFFGDLASKDRSATPDMFVNSSGNVGIGNDSPTTALDVTGTITTDGLTVDGNGSLLTFDNGSNPATISNTNGNITTDFDTTNAGRNYTIQANSINAFRIANGGDISFYEDTGTTAQMVWDASADALTFTDNTKAIFGAGSDLQIYHDSNNSYIEDAGTGDLIIKGANIEITTGAGNKYFRGAANVARLYHTDDEKLATTATGINVTGTASTDTLDVDDMQILSAQSSTPTDNVASLIYRTSGHADYANGDLIIQARSNASRDIYFLTGSTTPVNRMQINGNGDISFYEDTGTSEALFWDASTERLGIGTTSPSQFLDVSNTSGNANIVITASDTGTSSYTFGDSGGSFRGGMKYAHTDDELFLRSNGSDRITIDSSGNVIVGGDTAQQTSAVTLTAGGSIVNDGFIKPATDASYDLGASSFRYQNLYLSGSVKVPAASNGIEYSSTAYITPENNTSGAEVSTPGAFIIKTGTTPTERLRVTDTGNVGIGTDSPSAFLHTEGTSIGTESYAKFSTGSAAGDQILTIKSSSLRNHMALQVNSGAGAVDDLALNPDGGNVGIGIDSPSHPLTVDTGAGTFSVRAKGGSSVTIASDASMTYFGDTHEFSNAAGTSEFGRFDSSGNLLVGKTSADDFASAGVQIEPAGQITTSIGGDVALKLNRGTNDGNIIELYKAGAAVGSIGSNGGSLFIVGDTTSGNGAGLKFIDGSTERIVPATSGGGEVDNLVDLGQSTHRFKDLYLSGGVYLGGTGSANKLDDYEEGTWTPDYDTTNSDLANFSIFSGATSGKYTKVGNQVTVYGSIATFDAASISGTGNIVITGLPFSAVGNTNGEYKCVALTSDNRFTNNPSFGMLSNGTTTLKLYKTSAMNSANQMAVADMNATNTANFNLMSFVITYMTS